MLIYVNDENELANYPTNESELASIQGRWRIYDPIKWDNATYTFTGDKFTLTTNKRDAISGTVKVNNNILILIAEKWRTKGRAEGRAEGREEGRAEEAFDIAQNLVNLGLPIETVVSATRLDPQKVRSLYRQ